MQLVRIFLTPSLPELSGSIPLEIGSPAPITEGLTATILIQRPYRAESQGGMGPLVARWASFLRTGLGVYRRMNSDFTVRSPDSRLGAPPQ